MYRKYFVSHWDEAFEFDESLGTHRIKKGQNTLLEGFKEYLSTFLNLPQIDQMLNDKNGNSDAAKNLFDQLGKLQITL